jgi:hypothetical protein
VDVISAGLNRYIDMHRGHMVFPAFPDNGVKQRTLPHLDRKSKKWDSAAMKGTAEDKWRNVPFHEEIELIAPDSGDDFNRNRRAVGRNRRGRNGDAAGFDKVFRTENVKERFIDGNLLKMFFVPCRHKRGRPQQNKRGSNGTALQKGSSLHNWCRNERAGCISQLSCGKRFFI